MNERSIGLGSKSLLVVDDDPDILASVCDILEDSGFLVDVALNGETAIALVEQNHYDVALLDFKMPDMDGAELYARIRKRQSLTVAIMVTAYAGDDGIQRALDAGTWQVLRKPVDVAKLIGFIEAALLQKTVLVVDDDSEFCSSMWDTLRDCGFRVGVAHNTEDANKELSSGRYEIILLDLRLGDSNGLDVLSDLAKSEPYAQVIVVTGLDQNDELTLKASDLGVDCVYHKPINVGDLVARLRE